MPSLAAYEPPAPLSFGMPILPPLWCSAITSQQAGVEHRAAGAAALGRCAVVHAADAGDLRLAGGRPLVVEQLVVLEREGEIAAAGMADDVDARRRPPGPARRFAIGSGSMPVDRGVQAQDARVVDPVGELHRISPTRSVRSGSTASKTTSASSGRMPGVAPCSLTTWKLVMTSSSSAARDAESAARTKKPVPIRPPSRCRIAATERAVEPGLPPLVGLRPVLAEHRLELGPCRARLGRAGAADLPAPSRPAARQLPGAARAGCRPGRGRARRPRGPRPP